jgi:copper chaperone NosL
MKLPRLSWSALLAAAVLAACSNTAATLAAQEPGDETACTLDGMLLRDFGGSKAQIRYADGKTDYFCDVMELLGEMLAPEQHRAVSAAYVQDMGKTDWKQPRGHWIAARNALFVVDSAAQGSMGHTIAPFSQRTDADAFVLNHGGKVVRFEQITLAMLSRSATAEPAHGMH